MFSADKRFVMHKPYGMTDSSKGQYTSCHHIGLGHCSLELLGDWSYL